MDVECYGPFAGKPAPTKGLYQALARDDAVLALALGFVHRRIRAGKQVVDAFILGSEAGQALADGDAERLVVMVEAQPLNLPLQAFGHLHGHVWRAAGKHCGEFLTADPPEHIAATQCPASALGDPLQHVVAFLVAVGVVDHFEVIDVQQQERQRRALLPCLFELAMGAVEEVPAIAALGQPVGGGQALQFGSSCFLSVMSSAMPTMITGCPGSA
jgi:hypothetical protein